MHQRTSLSVTKTSITVLLTVALAGCGSAEGAFSRNAAAGAGGGGSSGDGPSGGADSGNGGAGGSGGGTSRELGPPLELVPGQPALVGLTGDGWVLFRDPDGLHAVSMESRPELEPVTERPGNVVIRGNVVFNWADVDWEANVGELSVWTAEAGAHELGSTLLAERLIAVNGDGTFIAYSANAEDESIDLVISPNDFSSSQTLIEDMGLGSEETCGASIGFVGERLFVAWCEPGSRAGRLDRFELDGDEWEVISLAPDALPVWSADETGERVLYLSSAYRAFFVEDGSEHAIDSGVSRGFVLPDGSAAFYTVGDQLRRTLLPDVKPEPVVTRGYSVPVEFSRTFEHALYSTTVTYEDGTQRDLRLVPTDVVDATPIELVADPVARLGRSSMTADGRFVLYLTDDESDGTTLHVVDVDGEERFALPNVVEVEAAYGSTIVFTDAPSDPDVYPVVSDLKILDVAADSEPELVEARIVGTRGFHLDANRERVAYVRSGVDRDEAEAERSGLFCREIR